MCVCTRERECVWQTVCAVESSNVVERDCVTHTHTLSLYYTASSSLLHTLPLLHTHFSSLYYTRKRNVCVVERRCVRGRERKAM